jgi:SAM-dependent methyltransferase
MTNADVPNRSQKEGGLEAAGHSYALAIDPAEVARYRLMADQARAAEADLWLRAGLKEGTHVADIGCGPGALLPVLAQAVGASGRVTAIDADPSAVAEARGLILATKLTTVTVSSGEAQRTEISSDSCDVVMLRHVLSHNGGREDAIVAHLATLLRPGGCLYLLDTDGTAVRTVPEDADLEDLGRHYIDFHTARGNDVRAGLRLSERLVRAGLALIEFRGAYLIKPIPAGLRSPAWAARDAMVASGAATRSDIARWAEAYDRLDAAETRPTQFVPMFAAIGRRQG